eukprot:1268265-Pleurochrysis_carterae.AAC.1
MQNGHHAICTNVHCQKLGNFQARNGTAEWVTLSSRTAPQHVSRHDRRRKRQGWRRAHLGTWTRHAVLPGLAAQSVRACGKGEI